MDKALLKQHCLAIIDQRIESLSQEMRSMRDENSDQAKSSAGDKHETGNATIHLELERLSARLELDQRNRYELASTSVNKCDTVEQGAIVEADGQMYFISIALGKIELDGQSVLLISPVSPIAQLLLGKKQGEHFEWRDRTVMIDQVS